MIDETFIRHYSDHVCFIYFYTYDFKDVIKLVLFDIYNSFDESYYLLPKIYPFLSFLTNYGKAK